jgi:hypothetical protein
MRSKPSSEKPLMWQISVYVDDELGQFIKQQAHQLFLTESAYIRQCLQTIKNNSKEIQ